MALSSCFFSSQVCVSLRVDSPRLPSNTSCNNIISQICAPALKSKNNEIFGQQVVGKTVNQCIGWSFLRGSRTISRPNLGRSILCRKSSAALIAETARSLLNALLKLCLEEIFKCETNKQENTAGFLPLLNKYIERPPCSQIASGAFTLGTAAVLPFYTLMVVAPRAEFTKKLVASSLPYMALGALYAYLLYLSWTPDTIQLMFASKYWLPELPGMAKMFSSEMTLASAWIHLLAVDLFAARQVYDDGLQNNIETRHSVSLCLLFCPIGILAHFITKALTRSRREKEHGIH